jgi:hypothetical protein
MNSNLFHNVANVAIVLLTGATGFMLATGCEMSPAQVLDCSGSSLNEWINPAITSSAAAMLGAVKMAVNVVRDGLAGLTKEQPPVK